MGAFDQGKRAFQDGKCRASNPYPKGKANAVRWNMGYDEARSEDDFLANWKEGRV